MTDTARAEFDVDLADINGLRLVVNRFDDNRVHAFVFADSVTLASAALAAPARGTGSTQRPEHTQPAPQGTPEPQVPAEAATAQAIENVDNNTDPSTNTNTAQVAEGIGFSRYATAVVECDPAGAGDLGPAAARTAGPVRIERGLPCDGEAAVQFYLDDVHVITCWLPEDLADALDEQLAAGWRPAVPGDTPGQVEPDDAQPQPQNLADDHDLWLIVAEVLATDGMDVAMWEDQAREILRRLGLTKAQPATDLTNQLVGLYERQIRRLADSLRPEDAPRTYPPAGDVVTAAMARIDGLRHLLAETQERVERERRRTLAAEQRNGRNLDRIEAQEKELATLTAQRDQAEADVTRLKTRLVAEQARLRGHLADMRARIATVTSDRPTSAEYGAAQAALTAAWPVLAPDPVFVEQLAYAALDAAWKINRTPRTEDTEPVIGPPRHDRYAQCDDTCTVDCGPCKGKGKPGELALRARSCPNCHSIGTPRLVPGDLGALCQHTWHDPR